MEIKVSNINNIIFNGVESTTKPKIYVADKNIQINNLSNVTPDYSIKIPQKYNKIGIDKLSNGLEIHSYKLANGYQVSIIPMEDSPTTVKNYVNVGALNETDDIKGISHFLEHMAFNGTIGNNGYIKLNTGDSFKKIEKLGGWTNASTGLAVTDYVNSTPMLEDEDLEEQIRVLAAMTENLALTNEMIKKEKGPVCSEIDMILDRPSTITFDQTLRTLFNIKSSADELIAGSTKHIKNLTREKVKAYYEKYYTPDNMNLVITGDVDPDETIKLVAKNFKSKKTKISKPFEENLIPIDKTTRKDFKFDKTKSNETIIGFAGFKNNSIKDLAIFDILSEYIYSAHFGLSKSLENKNTSFNFFAEKISSNKNAPNAIFIEKIGAEENSEETLKDIFEKFSNLKAPSEKEIESLKKELIIDFNNKSQYSGFVNSIVGRAVLDGTKEYAINYANIINSITRDDIQEFINKYIDLNKAAITVVHPTKQNEINFQGKNKKPVNLDKIEQYTLDNNIKVGFYNKKSDGINYEIEYFYDLPENINPAAFGILCEMYNNGTLNKNYDDFKKYQEENHITTNLNISKTSLIAYGSCGDNYDFPKALTNSLEQIYEPRFTQENFDRAIDIFTNHIERQEPIAYITFNNYESTSNKRVSSLKNIKEGLKTITLEDVKTLHEYILNNSKCLIKAVVPENNEIFDKNKALKAFESFGPALPFEYEEAKTFKPNEKPIVLTEVSNNSQADIMQSYKFKYDNSPKEIAMLEIMNNILSSSSIGLFNTLREKEHLAYSVYSNTVKKGDTYYLNCNILTTTDNKEKGECTYENVQKSINGFNRQIKCLLNSKFTDEDLVSSKRAVKANLLQNEGNSAKLGRLDSIYSEYGIEYPNLIYNEIDNITREDILSFAQKVFKDPPIYTIVATKNTLDANEEYLKNLEI